MRRNVSLATRLLRDPIRRKGSAHGRRRHSRFAQVLARYEFPERSAHLGRVGRGVRAHAKRAVCQRHGAAVQTNILLHQLHALPSRRKSAVFVEQRLHCQPGGATSPRVASRLLRCARKERRRTLEPSRGRINHKRPQDASRDGPRALRAVSRALVGGSRASR